ncbi:MAG TPA: tRNA (adenosine(37)-N6)-threonylcarbamoyltransferase complex ATPase subunit type 1 TsaE [Ilumatobacteraceae bacterium]|nr:tRNA (adenosine(37)-N6)-threonylcarbamoyltransferase complex ATPase subunit type 1 TsaE [Ilumatobacteraceae bacterium]
MLQVRSRSLADTQSLAAAIATLAKRGDLIMLAGEMGAGKTAFAQGFGRGLGIVEPITSPTFALVHSYAPGRVALHHADVYRLERHHELADLGLDELLDDGVVLVEWGDVIGNALGDHLLISLMTDADDDPTSRLVTITASGRQWTTRWDRLIEAVASR